MKVISPSFEILHFDDDAIEKICIAARTCYQSEPKGNSEEFVRRLIERQHLTPLEFASSTVKIICDRGVSHELVRHRLASFQQSSTRYCNYSKDKFGNELTFIKPCFWQPEVLKYDSWHNNQMGSYQLWLNAMQHAEHTYLELIKNGAKAQEARSVLPNSLKTEIIMSCNLRQLRHILDLRCSAKAHPQIRELCLPLLKEVYARCPVIFEDIYFKYYKKSNNEE